MAKQLLNDITLRNAKPDAKRLTDGDGLYILLRPDGGKWWRFDYTHQGKRKTLSLGTYPDTGLKDARGKANEARAQLASGIDPSDIRKQAKQAVQADTENAERKAAGLPILNSFEHAARDWLASIAHKTRDITHQKKTSRFELHVFPAIGNKLLADIKSPDIYALLKPLITLQKLETAHRIHAEIKAVYDYAIAHGRADYDPAQAVAKQIPAQKVKHRAAVTEPKDISQLLRDIYNYGGTFVVQCAFKFSPLVFQRPGEIRQMEWKDIDLAAKEWRYFVTKTEVQHIVPLSTQALAILEAIRPLTGDGRYVFPSSRGGGRPMSDNTIRTALRTLGYTSDEMTPHGFRSMASTLLNEQGWSPDAIERQLCHMPKDQVRAAYNRAQYLDERRKMMQAWADYLEGLRKGVEGVLSGHPASD